MIGRRRLVLGDGCGLLQKEVRRAHVGWVARKVGVALDEVLCEIVGIGTSGGTNCRWLHGNASLEASWTDSWSKTPTSI